MTQENTGPKDCCCDDKKKEKKYLVLDAGFGIKESLCWYLDNLCQGPLDWQESKRVQGTGDAQVFKGDKHINILLTLAFPQRQQASCDILYDNTEYPYPEFDLRYSAQKVFAVEPFPYSETKRRRTKVNVGVDIPSSVKFPYAPGGFKILATVSASICFAGFVPEDISPTAQAFVGIDIDVWRIPEVRIKTQQGTTDERYRVNVIQCSPGLGVEWWSRYRRDVESPPFDASYGHIRVDVNIRYSGWGVFLLDNNLNYVNAAVNITDIG